MRLHVSREVSIQDVWPRTGLDRLDLEVAVASNTTQLAECRPYRGPLCRRRPGHDTRPWHSGGDNMQMSLAFTGLSPKRTPATPNLYTLTVELSRNKQVLDSASMAIGFRTFEVSGERFLLNGKPYRWLGANMGPHGLPNDRALAHKFTSLMKEGNQNATPTVRPVSGGLAGEATGKAWRSVWRALGPGF